MTGVIEVRVSDLPADVPVRSKYLRKDDEEETQIRRTAERLALSHPEVAITYISDGKKIFRTPGTGIFMPPQALSRDEASRRISIRSGQTTSR